MTIIEVREFHFKQPDKNIIIMTVPDGLNQNLIRKIITSEYSVYKVGSSLEIKEADSARVKEKGVIGDVGYLIPGAAILSGYHPKIDDEYFVAYSMIVANHICRKSYENSYELCARGYENAHSADQIFDKDCYYIVIWDEKIKSRINFKKHYSLCLASQGLVLNENLGIPKNIPIKYATKNDILNIHSNELIYDHIHIILTELYPFTDNPFLRFFYIYQIIEHLISGVYHSIVENLISDLTSGLNDKAFTSIRDAINDFNNKSTESPRVKNLLNSPGDQDARKIAADILRDIEQYEKDMCFGASIYKIRNIIFHDYKLIHAKSNNIGELCDKLYIYILSKKILN
jgi:hypothetical protein